MATLVTGGVGFVGANIVKELARAGHQVVSLDLNGPDRLVEDFVRDQAPRVTFAVGDILDRAAVERMLESAVWAPNHRMTEPWRFFVLDKDSQARKKAADLAYEFALERSGNERRAEGTRQAVASPPVLMYVYYIPGPSDEATRENYAAVCCAVQNMSLAGVAEGLAVTWETGGATRHPKLAETLGAEEDWLMAGMLSLGVSDEQADSRRTPASNFVNWLP